MPTATCPTCGQPSTATSDVDQTRPDPTVVRWFTDAGTGLLGDLHVSEVYQLYLRACDGDPVSRRRFLADLDYLGAEADDDGNLSFG